MGGTRQHIIIQREEIKKVKEIEYLGKTITFRSKTDKETQSRIKTVWPNFWSLKIIYKMGKLALKPK